MLEKDDEADIESIINKLILFDLLEQQAEEDDSDRVQLMTLHASKGLEFNHVYLVGAEENILPHKNSIEGETIEEERRLMYVGITRAKKTLAITTANKRKQYGDWQHCEPSRFIEELPEEHIAKEGIGAPKQSEEERKAKGMANIEALKAMLNK